VRTLKPLDADTIAGSIAKTGRLVVVNEGPLTGGYAAEVVARMVETVGIDAFRATPARVAAKDTPIPYATALEREVLPNVDDLVAAVHTMTAG
jgi:pyruvate/2-oxoglutarate/acetoin dehydrogenase E1 component